MACPNCGCKTTYPYDDEMDHCGMDGMERCAACGKVFSYEEELPEDDEE